jgi:hypothetical protein
MLIVPVVEPAADVAREGLPFWIFWLLLSVILLLVFLIFLRDKDLRRRLSSFLSGAKRKMLRLRLQAKIRKEKEKKIELLKDLGKKAWSEDIQVEGSAEVCSTLKEVEEEKTADQLKWHEFYSAIEALGKEKESLRNGHLESVRKEQALKKSLEEKLASIEAREKEAEKSDLRTAREAGVTEGDSGTPGVFDATPGLREEAGRLMTEREVLRSEMASLDRKLRNLDNAFRERNQVLEKEIREKEKLRDKTQKRILDLKKTAEPLYESLGKIFDEKRLPHEYLTLDYFQIDTSNRAILDLQDKIEKLQ